MAKYAYNTKEKYGELYDDFDRPYIRFYRDTLNDFIKAVTLFQMGKPVNVNKGEIK